jgi:hypothetical protein
LTDEGVAQLFTQPQLGNRKIVGTVGELQYEVIQYRLEHEYGCHFFQPAIWNKKLFMKILDLDISLKNYEEDIVNNITENAKCYSIIYTITNDVSIPTLYFPHMHAINKGKWTFIKYPCLKALIEEYDIDTSSRGIDTTWLTNFQ